MKTFRQLYDPKQSVYYTIDSKAMMLTVSAEGMQREMRLKPFYAGILLALFDSHPEPVAYDEIGAVLMKNKIVCPDETRLHRKVSELRSAMKKLVPELDKLIVNIRGVGYSLPLGLKDPDTGSSLLSDKMSNPKMTKILEDIESYIEESVMLSEKSHIVKVDEGYVLDRKPYHAEIESLLKHYQEKAHKLMIETKLHKADFLSIRIEFLLAKLQTYIGLARISEFCIAKEQWLEWHEHEALHIMTGLIGLIKQSEQ